MMCAIRFYALSLLFGCLLCSASASALGLGSCESERGKLVFVLKHVFKPFMQNQTELSAMRQEIVSLSTSLDGWVEDIDDCYRSVFRFYHAPVNSAVLNDGVDWSMQMTDLKQELKKYLHAIRNSPEDDIFWQELSSLLRNKLPTIFEPNKPFRAMLARGEFT